MLIDKGINRKDLKRVSGISTASVAKPGKGKNIQAAVLVKICNAPNCGINDIMETVDALPKYDEGEQSVYRRRKVIIPKANMRI